MNDEATVPAAALLGDLDWLPVGASVVSTAIAGAGNMNLVERVTLSDGATLILKRAHGWVEKYPHIPAPVERAGVEAAFYAAVAGSAVGKAMPRHLGYDAANAANLFEDLGEGADGMSAYAGAAIATEDLDGVIAWAAALHALPTHSDVRLSNLAMRQLNAVHIFEFPLAVDNGFDVDAITPGLQSVADALKSDAAFVDTVNTVGARYLGSAPGVLLHGDLYPGSWLSKVDGLRIIDPEFCWVGPPEWDVGVLAAHLILSGQSTDLLDRLYARYPHPLDRRLADQVSGIEIMRRLIGVAQLPLSIDLAAKTALLERARMLVMGV